MEKRIYKSKPGHPHNGLPYYVDMVKCPTCQNDYELSTMDKSIIENPPSCFNCKLKLGKL